MLVFGRIRPAEWEPAWGQHWLAERADAPIAGNSEMAALSVVFARAVRAGLLQRNPCHEVRRYPSPPCTRYVSDAELQAFLMYSSKRTAAYVALKMATGARQGQLVNAHWADWSGTALLIRAAKGGRDTWYEGPGIRSALAGCASVFHGASLSEVRGLATAVVANRQGEPYKSAKYMIASLWHPAMKRFVAAGGVRFREHDLRAKVASDSADVHLAQQRLGHQTTAITQRVYMRAPRRVPSSDAHVGQRQPDLFDQSLGGPGASLKAKDRAPSKAATAATSPGSPAKSPLPPARAARELQGVPTKTLRGDR